MIGPIPTGTLATAQISARIHSGLAVKLPDGRPGKLAIVDESGAVVDASPAVMLAAAEALGIAPDEVRRQTQPESAVRTVKYRHPQMHDLTWTGRGKQPAWVRGWLEQGKALDDLLTEKASMSV